MSKYWRIVEISIYQLNVVVAARYSSESGEILVNRQSLITNESLGMFSMNGIGYGKSERTS
jgi:hypothetical protein